MSVSICVCVSADVYCKLQLQNARAAISRLVSSPSAKINMFVPGKTPLCHFSTFTLALQVRQAMPRPPPTYLSSGGWVVGWSTSGSWQCQCDSSKSKCITRKCIAYTQARARHLHQSQGRHRAEEKVPGPVWPTLATIKCYETLKVLSESANEAHETETANGNEMQQLREFLSTCCCCCSYCCCCCCCNSSCCCM